MQRRVFPILATAVAVGLAASGCTATATSSDELDLDAPVTLTVQQQTSQEGLFTFLADAFEKKYPNVTVELETVSQEQKTGSNLAVLGSSNPPDVGMIPINSEVYTQLTAANALAPLDDVFATSDLDNRYGDAVASSLKVDGVPYTVAFSQVIYNVVWLNPDALAAAGLTVPADHRFESVDQLIQYSDALRAAGLGGFQLAGGSGYQASWMIDAFLPTSSTSDQLDNYLSSYDPAVDITAKYTDEPFMKALDTLQSLNDAGIYQEGFLGQDAPTALAPFLQGQAGMALGGNFNTTDFDAATLAFQPDWALLPPVDGGTPTAPSLYFGDALGIPAQSDNVAWAKKFLDFVMSDDMQQQAVVDNAGLLPSVNSLAPDALKALPELTQQLVAESSANGGQPGWTSTVPGGFGQQFIDPLVQQMYSGELSPTDVGQKQQDHLLEYREQN